MAKAVKENEENPDAPVTENAKILKADIVYHREKYTTMDEQADAEQRGGSVVGAWYTVYSLI